MKIWVWRADSSIRNFGDELNLFIWPSILPELERPPGIFFGIGTVLHGELPSERPLIVFGSGAGYGIAPDLNAVDVRFVRGPLTASVLGISQWKAVTDPAILLARSFERDSKPKYAYSFMPRWTQILHDTTLVSRMEDLGIHVISPLDSPLSVIQQIASTGTLICEALHGAVIADALRIQWIPVMADRGHTFKWFDFCASLCLTWDPVDLQVSGLMWAKDNGRRMLSTSETHTRLIDRVCDEVEKLRIDLSML